MEGWNHRAFGKRVALARAELEDGEVSLRELARRAGVSPSELSRIERGERPSIGLVNLLSLCDALGVRLEWVVLGDGERRPKTTPPPESAAHVAASVVHRAPKGRATR